MQRVFSFRQGDRAEYLAQYILSSFAISVPVPRQEDVGTDFHCSLLKREGTNLRPYLPFNIQIKSYGKEVLTKGIRFGGLTDAGNWRKHEVEQLCQTDTPFIIGIVNAEKQTMDVFTTISRYFIFYNWKKTGLPREVALIPYEPKDAGHLGDGVLENLDAKPDMPNTIWNLPIGQPVLTISIADSEDPKKCEAIKATLEPYLTMDQENAVFCGIGLGYLNWPLIIRNGVPMKEVAVGLVAQGDASPTVQSQLKVLTRIAASLLRSYQIGNKKDKILMWEPVLNQLPIESESEVIRNSIKEALNYARS
jgi:hypothetical protein